MSNIGTVYAHPAPGQFNLQSLNGDVLQNRVSATFSDNMGSTIQVTAPMVDAGKASPKDALKASVKAAFDAAMKALEG